MAKSMDRRHLGIYQGKRAPGTYCIAEVDVGDGITLYVDGNSKITGSNGTFEDPKPNAFSLPARRHVSGEHQRVSVELLRAWVGEQRQRAA